MAPPDPTILTIAAGALAAAAAVVGLRAARLNYQTAHQNARRQAATLPGQPREAPLKSSLPNRAVFVNRDAELQLARTLVLGESVLAIEGDVGVGKSATALELAHRLKDPAHAPEARDLRDHAFLWFDCDGRCPELVALCTWMAPFTADQSLASAADDEKLAALRAYLARHPTVLLLDNLRLGQDRASEAMRAFLRGVPEGSYVIASVERPGASPGSRVTLHELDVPHVLELVRMAAQRHGVDDADALDEELARRLRDAVGGNPGTIDWFFQAVSLGARSVEELLVAVERGERLPELHMPIWRSLTETSRLVLAAFACLRGRATTEQLSVASDRSVETVSASLDELIATGSVRTVRETGQPNAYTCSSALWRFALVEAPEDVRDAITTRLARHYIDRLRNDPENARAIVPHVTAIRAVFDELAVRGRNDEIQALFRASLDILYTLGLFDDRLAAGRLAYDSAQRVGDHVAASLAADAMLGVYGLRGEFDKAREALAHGYQAAALSGSPAELARQRASEGFLEYRARRPREALRVIDGSDDMARHANDLETLVNILILRSAAQWYLGAFADTEVTARECIAVCEEMGWKRAVAWPLRLLAELAIQDGRLDEARELLARSRAISVEHDDRRALTRVLLTEARLLLVARRAREAGRVARTAEADAAALGLPPEAEEARALRRAARRVLVLPSARRRFAQRPPHRLSDAAVGGG